jgi:carbamoyltransferase
MKILGISDHLTCGAALLQEGRLLAAVNEERLIRKKMVLGFPRKAIAEVLALAGVKPSELDCVAVASETGHFLNDYVDFDNGTFGIEEGLLKGLFFSIGSQASFLRGKVPIIEDLYYTMKQPVFAQRRRKVQAVLKEEFGITCPVVFVSHHLAHAAAAYYASGYQDGLLVTLDGAGDGHSSHIYDARNGKLKLLHAVPAFDSLGCYYAYATEICGFKAGRHEGKLTGLAAYGKPAYEQIIESYIRYENGSMTNIGNVYRQSAIKKLRSRLPKDLSKADLACTIQKVSEDITARYISHWLKQTGHRNVALAGGVFANVKINQRVHEIEGVESVFVYPAMSDEGISAGAALVRWAESNPEPAFQGHRCFDHVYLGREFSEASIAEALSANGVPCSMPEDPEADIAKLIAEGYVVARFNGPMEYGPRALGNRSILYRPDEPEVNDWLNKRLRRTEFMPFAPSILNEDAEEFLQGIRGARDTARFMTITFDCTAKMKELCPGVVHVDGTARPQLVRSSDNPSYYRIISEYKRLTGVGCIVNTSYNMHEEPIVCTPDDAIRSFKEGHLDVLAIGPFIAMGPGAEQRVAAARQRSKGAESSRLEMETSSQQAG